MYYYDISNFMHVYLSGTDINIFFDIGVKTTDMDTFIGVKLLIWTLK
jgi:hypothetical protein